MLVLHVSSFPGSSAPASVGVRLPPLVKLAPPAYSQLGGSLSATLRFLAATVEVFFTITRHVKGWPTSALALAWYLAPSSAAFSTVIVGSATFALSVFSLPA